MANPLTFLLPDLLSDAGVNVRVLDDWQEPHKNGTYLWRENAGEPSGAMWHHTATSQYTPNRDKANGYAGLSMPDSLRLSQSGSGDPIYTIANAYPGPITSGYGVKTLLDDYVKADVRFLGKQTQPDYPPGWAGNTHYWNTEVILDGVGAEMAQRVWDMNVVVARVLSELYGWSAWRHVGHGQHTTRKPDLNDGRYPDMAATLLAFQDDVHDALQEEPMITHFTVGMEDPLYEEISWLLYQLNGGTINVNAPSSQVEDELGKTNVRLVTDDDFTLIADLLSMSSSKRAALFDPAVGLYRFGKEIAKLRNLTYS